MRSKRIITGLFILTLLLFLYSNSYSQCSDAGVCSLSGHKNTEEEEAGTNSSVSLNGRIGYSGDIDDVTYYSIISSGNFALSKNISGRFSFPYNLQSGPAGDFNGIGDLIVGFNYNHPINKEISLDFQVGGKFATGDANLGTSPDSATSLPLTYQSGMGTNDILLGVTYNNMGFTATLGGQIPLDRSKNTNSQLKRGPDVLLGLGYTFPVGEQVFLTGEVLTIKRLTKSNVILTTAVPNPDNTGFDAPDSDFLQMNIQITMNYLVNRNVGINLSGAVPLLNRETNYDGTKRAFTVSAGASYLFNMNL